MLKIKGMKKQYHTVKLPVVLILLMMAISFCLQAQSTVKTYSVNPDQSKNYILTITPQEASTKLGVSTFIGSTRRSDQVKDEIGYFDGLGRALQSIGVNASPGGKDILLPTEYDEFGKETKKYLPYTVDGNNGLFRNNAISEQQSFYSLRYPNEPAFQQTILDGSQHGNPITQTMPIQDMFYSIVITLISLQTGMYTSGSLMKPRTKSITGTSEIILWDMRQLQHGMKTAINRPS
jgi:hypothetical protein